MARLFIAIELSETMHDELARLIHKHATHAPRAKWVKAKTAHLTLEFLGDWPDDARGLLDDMLKRIATRHAPFELHVAQGGTFGPPNSPRVLWLDVSGDISALGAIQKDIQRELVSLGHVPEAREFRPHLTLARARTPRGDADLEKAVEALKTTSLGTLPVHSFQLFSSELSSTGAIHTPLLNLHLSGHAERDY